MKKALKTILILVLFTGHAFAQNDKLQEHIDKGIKLYDQGNYKGAIEEYKKALKIDKTSSSANYEIASTYYALGEYDKAAEYADNVIANGKENMVAAYILKGSALDSDGKPKDAIKTYKQGIKGFPDDNLLYYNLGLTLYEMKEYKDAEDAVQRSLKLKPTHASSHLLLAYIMNDQNSRVKSLLALYNFLLLEPTGSRAKTALPMLDALMKKGVSKDSPNSTTITMSPDSKDGDDFRAADLMLSMLAASKGLETNENKTEYELFSENTGSFFAVLGELKKDSKGFWWEYYVDYFYAMKNAGHVDAFSYYITQSRKDEKINAWLKSNDGKVDALMKWHTGYERKF